MSITPSRCRQRALVRVERAHVRALLLALALALALALRVSLPEPLYASSTRALEDPARNESYIT